jgi:hypothetical protein
MKTKGARARGKPRKTWLSLGKAGFAGSATGDDYARNTIPIRMPDHRFRSCGDGSPALSPSESRSAA